MLARRHIVILSGAAVLGGCSLVTTSGGTVTVNTAELLTDAKAITNGGAALLAIPAIGAAVPGGVGILKAILAAATTLNQGTGPSSTLTFSAASAPVALTDLMGDVRTLFGAVQAAMQAMGSSAPAAAVEVFTAFETIAAVVLALLPAAAASPNGPVQRMPRGEAMAILLMPAP